MKKNILIGFFALVIVAGASFTAGTYFMYDRITSSEDVAANSAEKKITELSTLNKDDIANHFYTSIDFPQFRWKYSIALSDETQTNQLQKEAGESFGKYYYEKLQLDQEHSKAQSEIIRQASNEITKLKEDKSELRKQFATLQIQDLQQQIAAVKVQTNLMQKLTNITVEKQSLLEENLTLQREYVSASNFKINVASCLNDSTCSESPYLCQKLIGLFK
jgi:hypothetical protein